MKLRNKCYRRNYKNNKTIARLDFIKTFENAFFMQQELFLMSP